MMNRERDNREKTEDEKRVLQIFKEELDYEYVSNLWVRRTKDAYTGTENGWELELSLNNIDKPMYITYIGDSKEKFFEVVRMQIHEDNIPSHVAYCYAQRFETVKNC